MNTINNTWNQKIYYHSTSFTCYFTLLSFIIYSYTTEPQTTHFKKWCTTTVDADSAELLEVSHNYGVSSQTGGVTPDTIECQTSKLPPPVESNTTSTKGGS